MIEHLVNAYFEDGGSNIIANRGKIRFNHILKNYIHDTISAIA